jgi:DNA repair exonuclease SbcCD ATPase subunit
MKLEYLKQVMINFKAFTGRHEMLWDSPGLNLIGGENQLDKDLIANGAAKSTIFDAWCWCLFGRTPRGGRNPDVTPWRNETDEPTSVTLVIRINEEGHTITRTIGPNRLTLDDQDIDQEKLEAKLGLNFELATNTLLLAQNKALFFDRTPEKKMELFAETLGLERWDVRSEQAADKRDVNEAKVQKYTVERETNKAALVEVLGELMMAKEDAEKWGREADVTKRAAQDKVKELEQSLEKQEQLLGGANLAEDGASTELKALRAEGFKLLEESRAAARQLDQAVLTIEDARRKQLACQDALNELLQAKVCPTCGQPVKQSNLHKHKAELQQQFDAHQAVLNTGIPKRLSRAVLDTKRKMEAAAEHLVSFEAKEEAARRETARLVPEVARMRAELKEQKKILDTLAKVDANPFYAQIKRLREREKVILEDELAIERDLKRAQQLVEQYKVWVRGFKDIKLQLIDETLGELEIVTNAMLPDVGLSGWEVRYDIEKELKSGDTKRVFNVEIASPDSVGFVKWESWSGGEGERLKLIGALALSDVLLAKAGVETNLEILDEPAKYWSAPSVQDLSAFLADRARTTGKSIYLVEHQAAQSAHFSNILTVIKDDKGSYIAED